MNRYLCLLMIILAHAALSEAQAVDGSLTFKGPSPWIDVTNPAYGAKCDGVTDDTAAFQAALNAANAARTTVFIPVTSATCMVSQWNLDSFSGVSVVGPSEIWPGFGRPSVAFTSGVGPLISIRNSNGIRISGLSLVSNNPAMTGTFIDTAHTTGSDSAALQFEHLHLSGVFAVNNPSVLLSLDHATDVTIEDVSFNAAHVAVRGAIDNSGFSNVVHIRDSSFQSNITTAHIQNPGFNWLIESNAFEIGNAPMQTIGFANGFTSATGIAVIGNFDGDDVATVPYTKYTIPAGSTGWFFTGNLISATHNNVTGFSIGNNATGIEITGNTFASGSIFGTLFSLGTGVGLDVDQNTYGTISIFMSGTPATGSVKDNTGKTTYYGELDLGATGVATAAGNIGSTSLIFNNSGWNGSAPFADQWQISSGTSSTIPNPPNSFLTFMHNAGTNGAIVSFQQAAPATAVANVNSPATIWVGNYWTGTASAADVFELSTIEGGGANPTATFTLTHIGSSGAPGVDFSGAGTFKAGAGGVILPGATSGSTTLKTVATAGTNSATFPAATGTVLLSGNGASPVQARRNTAGCLTAAAVGAACSVTVAWTTPFSDANYTITGCTGNGIAAGAPVIQGITAKSAASITVQTVALTAVMAQLATIECAAIHD